jgi:hypothetical protein
MSSLFTSPPDPLSNLIGEGKTRAARRGEVKRSNDRNHYLQRIKTCPGGT